MDIFTPEQQQLIDSLEVYAQAEVAKATKPLQDLIDLVNSCVEIKLVNGSVVSEINLSAFELEPGHAHSRRVLPAPVSAQPVQCEKHVP